MGKTKKISSIIVHLQRKWKAALSDGVLLRLFPAVQGGVAPNFSWTEEDKCVIVSRIYNLLQCRQGVIRLDYELVNENQPQASAIPSHLVSEELLFTPSLEANFSEFLNDIENIDSINVSSPTPPPSVALFPPEDQGFLSSLADVDTPSTPIELDVDLHPPTLPEDTLLPLPDVLQLKSSLDDGDEVDLLAATPFQPRRSGSATSLDERSQDAFHLRDREYEGKCREYWFQCEVGLRDFNQSSLVINKSFLTGITRLF